MWLVKSSWCLPCCSIHQFTGLAIVAEATLHCGDFLFEKKCRHTTGNFSFFLVFTTRHSLSFLKFERQSCLFGLIMPCLLVEGTWECLIIDFSFFLWNHMFLCVYQWCGFSRYKFFHFDHSVWLILSFWCAQFCSFIQFNWISGRCTGEFALECFCLNKVVTNW